MLVFEEDGYWFVQSLLLDYLACGKTEKEALYNFNHGLLETMKLCNMIQ